jgi:acetyltransferase
MLDVGWGFFPTSALMINASILFTSPSATLRSFRCAREVFQQTHIVIKAGRSAFCCRAANRRNDWQSKFTTRLSVAAASPRRTHLSFQLADVPNNNRALAAHVPHHPHQCWRLRRSRHRHPLAIGGELPPLSESATQQLNSFLPPHWSQANPIDILGDADPERYARATDIALQDPNSDGLLVILAPQGMTDPAQVAEGLKVHARTHGKPILASWMGGQAVEPGVKILTAAGIPAFDYPDSAVRAFKSMWNYTYNVRGLYETPFSADDPAVLSGRKETARRLVETAANSGRTLLTELESKEILKLYGIPTVPTVLAQSEEEAAVKAKETGFPVVLKLHSETITHKTEVGGVQLNLENDKQVREAYRVIESSVAAKAGRAGFQGVTVQPMVRAQGYELILGSTIDAQFGPVILFGSGGQLVEVYRDRALALPPLNTTLATRLMEQTKILKALRGVRGRKPVDLPSLETLLVRFSELVVAESSL